MIGDMIDRKSQSNVKIAACQLAAKSTKYQMLLCLTNCLQSTPMSVHIRQSNIKIKFGCAFTLFEQFLTLQLHGIFTIYLNCLGKTTTNTVSFPTFHNGCNPACEMWALDGRIVLHGSCFNPRVAQNERFIMKPVYLGGSTMVPTRGKILNFRLSESLKNKLSRTFCSPKVSLESCTVFVRTFLNIHVI